MERFEYYADAGCVQYKTKQKLNKTRSKTEGWRTHNRHGDTSNGKIYILNLNEFKEYVEDHKKYNLGVEDYIIRIEHDKVKKLTLSDYDCEFNAIATKSFNTPQHICIIAMNSVVFFIVEEESVMDRLQMMGFNTIKEDGVVFKYSYLHVRTVPE